jgi:hypothetical protein
MVEVLAAFLSMKGVSMPAPVSFKTTAENGAEHGIRAWSTLFGLLSKTSVCWGKGRWPESVLCLLPPSLVILTLTVFLAQKASNFGQ